VRGTLRFRMQTIRFDGLDTGVADRLVHQHFLRSHVSLIATPASLTLGRDRVPSEGHRGQ
jgi:hypothetical protein